MIDFKHHNETVLRVVFVVVWRGYMGHPKLRIDHGQRIIISQWNLGVIMSY